MKQLLEGIVKRHALPTRHRHCVQENFHCCQCTIIYAQEQDTSIVYYIDNKSDNPTKLAVGKVQTLILTPAHDREGWFHIVVSCNTRWSKKVNAQYIIHFT
jgi:hypothetical protein